MLLTPSSAVFRFLSIEISRGRWWRVRVAAFSGGGQRRDRLIEEDAEDGCLATVEWSALMLVQVSFNVRIASCGINLNCPTKQRFKKGRSDWMNKRRNDWRKEGRLDGRKKGRKERMIEGMKEGRNDWSNDRRKEWLKEWRNEGRNDWRNERRREGIIEEMNEGKKEWLKEEMKWGMTEGRKQASKAGMTEG